MQCFKCNAECPDGANFCPTCGRSFRKASRAQTPKPRPNPYPHPESMTALAVEQHRRTKYVLALGTVAAIFAGVIAWGISASWPIGVVCGLISIVLVFSQFNDIRASNYYSIPYSLDSEGEHRCIFCGNRGIFHRGEYRTTNTYANCSKCKEFLYRE